MSKSVVDQASKSESNLDSHAAVTTEEQIDVLNRLLKPEIQQSLNVLIDNLPKLSEMLIVLIRTYDTAHSLVTDDVLKKDTVGAMQQFIEPLEENVKNLAANAIEAKDRAEANSSTIGLFGLLHMLKDPQAQKLFRFIQAYLDITNEKQK
ncbi:MULTISPECIES: helical membrane plugin domain-containing protein [Priestia]|uniref:DUF1641 domain-containing protein n=1 Tax=Priestia TaxID=2800373 RepID=UPI00099097C8|nr:DUF1641 domain-containing protein [Priestia megaterium]RFB33176.1 DUF1641 domain-containing protein [Bacillus sp. RC]AQU77005.1 hypothetical protein BUW91_27710 [Priestia megaterium]MCA4157406.1 DUF1641 domain-containing protein [Priestia megaterium]MCR8866986.1 DUF1641 domain-containing protein [Priestia megaterium]MDC7783838.1 DUF1641 domain-containing protein [Priestia megaterium]